MDVQERMAAALAKNPGLGRESLAREAGTTVNKARGYLLKNRISAPNAPAPPPTDPSPSREARLLMENKHLKQQLTVQAEELLRLSAAADLLKDVSSAQLTPPAWLLTPSGKSHRAIPTAVLTDTHFDEVVYPAELGGVNAYNREIAQLRLRNFFGNTVKLGRDIFAGIRMEGLVLPMAGDMVSGNIHEELARSNAAEILDTCLFWSEEIAAGIETLFTFYPQIFAPCVVGNHGRQSKKPKAKGRVKDNFDYLIYSLVARHFKNDSRISFLIPETADAHYQIYDTKYCLTHGDQFKGGSGIAGALSPLLLGDARKRKRSNATNKSYHHLVMGHWHQEIDAKGIIACNSLKGYDEYAMLGNFEFSEPTQSFWLTDPEKGRTVRAPIHVRDANERWDFEATTSPGWLASVPG